ncbi:MAG TPA: hypothetical protein VHD56_02245 [Tepidisphaeraceae bacterium]|nr:hypothetical protein [Tepidisphaeraceae bacterium]
MVNTNYGTITLTNTGSNSGTNTATQTFSSNDPSKLTGPQITNLPSGGAGSISGGGSISMPSNIDPMLRYLAATALFQEGAIIDRYVKDAAINDEFDPYVVRLQVSLLPSARNAPYDAYSNISFFSGDFPVPSTPTVSTPSSPSLGDKLLSFFHKKETSRVTTLPYDATLTGKSNVRLIPLLVTDDIEATIESRSLEQMRQLVLALQAGYAGITGELGVNSVYDKLQVALGRDFNSTFTVARVSENTLRVRFGALQQPKSGYAMIPQTHNVSLLVLVPKPDKRAKTIADNAHDAFGVSVNKDSDARMVHLVAKTSFIDANTGEVLPVKDKVYYTALRDALLNNQIKFSHHALSDDNSDASEFTGKLTRLIAANDYDAFLKWWRSDFDNNYPGITFPDRLWADLASIRSLSPYQSATFQLPLDKSPISLGANTVISPLTDVSASTATITVTPVADFDSTKVISWLTLTNKQDKTVMKIPAQLVEVKGNSLVGSFPSLNNLHLKPAEWDVHFDARIVNSRLEVNSVQFSADVSMLPIPAPKPSTIQLALSASSVNSSGGNGIVKIGVSGIPAGTPATVLVSGAEVTKADSDGTKIDTTVKDGSSTFTLSKDSVVTLQLTNLSPLLPVSIAVKQDKTVIQTAYLPVFELPSKPKGE